MQGKFFGTPGYHISFPVIRQHRISYRATVSVLDTRTDLWEPATDLPLFASSGPVVVSSSSASDDGKTVGVSGLGADGDFQFDDVIVGDPATAKIWRPPLAQIRLAGASGVRTGSVGTITATIGGSTVAAVISTGAVKSHTGCREVPAGERWVVTSVSSSLFVDNETGVSDAIVFVSLMESHPEALVDAQREWRIGSPILPDEFFLEGSFFFVAATSSKVGAIVVGEIGVNVFEE